MSATVGSTQPHNVVFAVAAMVFILMLGGLVFFECLALFARKDDASRKILGVPPRRGYFGIVSNVLTGPSPKQFRRLAIPVLCVSAVVAVFALLV